MDQKMCQADHRYNWMNRNKHTCTIKKKKSKMLTFCHSILQLYKKNMLEGHLWVIMLGKKVLQSQYNTLFKIYLTRPIIII